jgi:uncharacterized protein YfaQ (DUF2300 family)
MSVRSLVSCVFSAGVVASFVGLTQASAQASLVTPELTVRLMSRAGILQPEAAPSSAAIPITPLGSLWKLFVYAYQAETGRDEPDYTCRGQDPEEIFCCAPGGSIDRDLALAKSCAPYFSPARLAIDPFRWKSFWSSRLPHAPLWLIDLEKQKPETRVAVDELLKVLTEIRGEFTSFERIESAALGTVLRGTATPTLKTFGSTLRVKTFTWRDDATKEAPDADSQGFTGGFAGWLADGRAIWVSRAGHGRDAFQKDLEKLLQKEDASVATVDSGCVAVRYFDRYPIASVLPGGLHPRGQLKIRFKNGHLLSFHSDGSLAVNSSSDSVKVTAKLSVNEYVARVLDREVKTEPIEASRAFAIAIRTYLYQNSELKDGCRSIADSSHRQRVSPESASTAALKIARWSDGLVLEHVPRLRYHSTKPSAGVMAWSEATSLAASGYSSVEILKSAYPTGVIAFSSFLKKIECRPNLSVEKWISTQSKRWWRKLDREPGFERPDQLKVCAIEALNSGQMKRAFSFTSAQEMYVPRLASRDDEVSVLHEYLHIAFRGHPRGQDEKFVESMARLILEER